MHTLVSRAIADDRRKTEREREKGVGRALEMEEERREWEREGEEEGEGEGEEEVSEVLRGRFRLSSISIAEAQARKSGMEISEPIVACISDLTFKYTEQLAKDLELFSQHAGRKTVNMEDVILSAHRNKSLASSLRSFCNDLKAKEIPSERKRKKASRKEDRASASVAHFPDL